MDELPGVSIVIPTYNSAKVLGECLRSIADQDHPADKLEVIIADGGSTDGTINIAQQFNGIKILPNPLQTGEAGKAVGAKAAKNEVIAFIDSDNILPSPDWLKKMVEPFKDKEVAGSEPLYYTHRKEDGYITRYCALMGMNDPLCLFLGNYDRYCHLTGKWTEVELHQEDKGGYLKVQFNERQLPTVGANGFLMRRELLEEWPIKDYFFDIDVVYQLVKRGHRTFAKVKVGIVHVFCGSTSTFVRKQRRRVNDYCYYNRLNLRQYPWASLNRKKLLKFMAYTLLVIPLLMQVLKGSLRKRDRAWLFHIPACWITFAVYGFGVIRNLFVASPEDRSEWAGQG